MAPEGVLCDAAVLATLFCSNVLEVRLNVMLRARADATRIRLRHALRTICSIYSSYPPDYEHFPTICELACFGNIESKKHAPRFL